MKTNYSFNFSRSFFAFALLFSTTVFAQQSTRDKISTTPVIVASPASASYRSGDDGAQHLFTPGAGYTTQGTGCDSLKTTFVGGNGNDGIMFDVVANLQIKISFIDIVLYGTTDYVYIYHRTGTHVGHESSSVGWTVDSAQVNISAQDVLYRVPFYLDLPMNVNDTMAFYVTGSGTASVDYTDGTNVGNVYSQDFGMKILEGTGTVFPFAGSYTPRIFNGVVNYCPTGIQPCESTSTTYAGGNGHDGAMFDVTSDIDVTVNSISVNMNGVGYMKVYRHTGTYAGTESTPAAWTLVDSALVASVGANMPTIIPVSMNINISAGQTMAFYVTGNGSGADVNYTNGTSVGSVYSNDGIVSIKEGTGLGYPFAGPGSTPRVFNGTIGYCVATGISSVSATNLVTSSVYPNPLSTTATLEIDFVNHPENVSVQIMDVSGRILQTIQNVTGNKVTIDATAMSSGLYFYTIYSGAGQMSTGKFIVE
ncbi:hypothetical protein BH11BAC7_BH11BAC7_11810 [soil metagenome]